MNRTIFISLAVTDLKASMAFYEALGFKNNLRFTDETSACMVWSDTISFMLLTHAKWKTFTDRPIPPRTSSEVMLALSCDSRDAVDAMSHAAAENGGAADINPVEDHGFMYTRDMADPDGHALGRCGWTCPRCLRAARQAERFTCGRITSRRAAPARAKPGSDVRHRSKAAAAMSRNA